MTDDKTPLRGAALRQTPERRSSRRTAARIRCDRTRRPGTPRARPAPCRRRRVAGQAAPQHRHQRRRTVAARVVEPVVDPQQPSARTQRRARRREIPFVAITGRPPAIDDDGVGARASIGAHLRANAARQPARADVIARARQVVRRHQRRGVQLRQGRRQRTQRVHGAAPWPSSVRSPANDSRCANASPTSAAQACNAGSGNGRLGHGASPRSALTNDWAAGVAITKASRSQCPNDAALRASR